MTHTCWWCSRNSRTLESTWRKGNDSKVHATLTCCSDCRKCAWLDCPYPLVLRAWWGEVALNRGEWNINHSPSGWSRHCWLAILLVTTLEKSATCSYISEKVCYNIKKIWVIVGLGSNVGVLWNVCKRKGTADWQTAVISFLENLFVLLLFISKQKDFRNGWFSDNLFNIIACF